MFEPIMLPRAICEELKSAAKIELKNSGADVTEATKTVPTTTLCMFRLWARRSAAFTIFFEPVYRSSKLAMKAAMLNDKIICNP
jgi:hypothetical protein